MIKLFKSHKDCNQLLVSFAGLARKPGMPIAEFKSVLAGSDITINQLFIYDEYDSWYLYKYDRFIEEISPFVEKYGKDKTVFIGNSMGGFGAILIGSFMSPNLVIAFSPQTYLDKQTRDKFDDKRWKDQVKNVEIFMQDPWYLKLRNILEIDDAYERIIDTRFVVYYAAGDKLDLSHVDQLRGLQNFIFKPFDYDDHTLITALRDSGKLKQILSEHL